MSDLSCKESAHNEDQERGAATKGSFESIWLPIISSGRSWLVGKHEECNLGGKHGALFAVRFPLSCMIQDLFCPLCKEPAKHSWVLRFPLTIEKLANDFPAMFVDSVWAICGHELCKEAPDGPLPFMARIPEYDRWEETRFYCPLCTKPTGSVFCFSIDLEDNHV